LQLPDLDPAALAHSQRLQDVIRAEIEAKGGAMEFSRFMELALYAPGLGYYTAGQQKFGEQGDFVTAPELGGLFAACVARCCHDGLAQCGGGDIWEFGAGTGALAAGLLRELGRRDGLPRRYRIMELSPELRARQRRRLERAVPEYVDRVSWEDALPGDLGDAVIVANEVLDAMPVMRFCVDDGSPRLVHVVPRGSSFGESLQQGPANQLAAVAGLGLAKGYCSELHPAAAAWVASLAERLRRGLLLIVDYGYPEREYYHPQRTQGTLMCHYRHRAHVDPYRLVGLQDITAHVNFSAIARSGVDAGLKLTGYTSQAAFLIAAGLLDLAAREEPAGEAARLALTRQVQRLTSPAEMGESFKAMALSKDLQRPLTGFGLFDQRRRL
jgi:SAM-dependent MidA family methyltransferase